MRLIGRRAVVPTGLQARLPRLVGGCLGLLLCVAVLAGAATVQASAAARHPAPDMQSTLDRIVQSAQVPGGVLLIRSHGRTWLGASGLSETAPRTRMRADARFRVPGVTPPMVATIVLQLVAEGRLSLEDPVERWLPGLIPNGRDVLLRQLLNHTAGLPEYIQLPDVLAPYRKDPRHVTPAGELVRLAYATPAAIDTPGDRFAYSNTNYVALGLVVEAVTGAPLADAIATRLAQPLGLGHTLLPPTAAIPAPFAHGYTRFEDLWVPPHGGRQLDVTAVDPSIWAGAAGMVSNAHDVGRFLDALFSGKVLAPAQLAAVTTLTRETSSPEDRARGYGFGMLVIRTPCGLAYGHPGSIPGYAAWAYRSRDGKRTGVLLLNGDLGYKNYGSVERRFFAAFCR